MSKLNRLRRFASLLRPQRKRIILAFLVAVPSAAVQLIIPLLTGECIDRMVEAGRVDFSSVVYILALILTSALVGMLSGWCVGDLSVKISSYIARDLKDRAADKLQTLPLSYLDSHNSGDTLSRIVSDTDTFAEGVRMTITRLFTGGVMIVGTIGVMLSVNAPLALTVILLTPLSLFFAAFISGKISKMFRRQSEIRAELTSYINEMTDAHSVVKLFGRERTTCGEFGEINERMRSTGTRAVFFSSLVNPTTRFVNSLVYAAVCFGGAVSAVSGALSVGQLSCFLSYANQYSKPFNDISAVIAELENAYVCGVRIQELLDATPEEDSGKITLVSDGTVELKNVSFGYDKSRQLINNLSLSVRKGMRVAIVGPTGCGKTTLINLLMRFYDVDGGQVYNGGADVRSVTRSSLRSNIAMVLQETWLKNASVRDNIAYGVPEADDDAVRNAARMAHADAFIRRLPNGYDTVLGEGTNSLSAGERQLLCIARVMLMLPPVLILDEATSNIDTRTEVKVQSAFARMMKGRTSFVVAHRLSTIKDSDLILVMRDGNVIEQGTHESLLASGGFYAKLYNSQFEHQ